MMPLQSSNYNPLNLHILLVEDDVANAQYAQKVLRRMGCEVTLVESAEAAMEIYVPGRHHLILLDIHLPEMNGVDFIRHLRFEESRQSLPSVPVEVLTADALTSNRSDCLGSGANGFMSKPIKPAQIYEVLSRYAKN